MHAITYSRFGGPEVLEYGELPLPVAGPGEALVRVFAAGVNPVDLAVREGQLREVVPAQFPVVPGWDLAGVVEAVGEGVGDLIPGDRVWGYVRRDIVQQGSYAMFAVCEVSSLAIRPDGLSDEAAAGLPLVGLTALQSLRAAGVGRGDTVLIGSAGGGVGHVAVQVALAMGAARVIGTAGDTSRELVRAVGAEAIPYGAGLVERVRTLSPHGVDAAVDLHGGEALDAAYALVSDPKRVVSIAEPGVAERGGTYIFCEPSRRDLDQLAEWVRQGRLRVHVSEVVPLAEARRAQELVATGHTLGKVVLRM